MCDSILDFGVRLFKNLGHFNRQVAQLFSSFLYRRKLTLINSNEQTLECSYEKHLV